jgi:hypothetical protein
MALIVLGRYGGRYCAALAAELLDQSHGVGQYLVQVVVGTRLIDESNINLLHPQR